MLAVQLTKLAFAEVNIGGVSSFGYSGTIVHALLHYADISPSPLQMSNWHRIYRRRAIPWCKKVSLCTRRTTQAHLLAFSAAQLALDEAVAAPVQLPGYAQVAIAGAGLSGLLLASIFASVSPLVLIEKSSRVGGTWRSHGNAFSRVNSSEPSYRLPIIRKEPNTNHSYESEILTDALRAIMQHTLASRIHTHAEVRYATASSDGWLLAGLRYAVQNFALACGFVVLCTNRRLGRPRRLRLLGENKFQGSVKRGMGGDVDDLHRRQH